MRLKEKKYQSELPCHPMCQRSDPRREILCRCPCGGQRHGEKWMEDHKGKEANDVLFYYTDQLRRWESWSKRSKIQTRRMFSVLRAVN